MAESAVAADVVEIILVPESSKSSPASPIANGSYDATRIPNQSHKEQIPNSLSPIKSSLISNYPQTIPDNSNMLDDNTENMSPKSSLSHISNKSPSLFAVSTTPLSLSTSSHRNMNEVDRSKCNTTPRSSLESPVRLMHSMNSAKNLMCPKCNWHYKYQETLEFHIKEKHPETCLYCATNQPHPPLSYGKIYTCGYKQYRCEICNYSTMIQRNFSRHLQSDKHINVQDLQNHSLAVQHISALQQQSQKKQQNSQADASSPVVVLSSNPASEALKKAQVIPKELANFRCDVCNYETNAARNLKLHKKSKKHTHNIEQQNMKHLSAIQQAQMDPAFQFHSVLLMPAEAQLQPETNMTYNHEQLMMTSQQQHHQQKFYYQQQQRAMDSASAAANAKNHHLLGPLNLSHHPALDIKHPNKMLSPDFLYEDKNKIYQCCVCSIYSSDSLEALSLHVHLDRCRLRQDEVLMVVSGTFICKLCMYKTNMEDNLKRHCKTDKHLQRLRHVKEGGSKNDLKLKYNNNRNPVVVVRCNACEYYTNSLHKLQLHTTNPTHEANGRLFLFLERSESVINSEFKSFHCMMCNVSVRTKVNLIQHVNSLEHLINENLRQTQGESEPDMRDIFIVKGAKQATSETLTNENGGIKGGKNRPECHQLNDELTIEDNKSTKNSDTFMLDQSSDSSENGNFDALHTCPFCNFSSSSEVRIQIHVVSQHTRKPLSALVCPLCQDGFQKWGDVKIHLMDTHHVDKEGVKRLLALVDRTEWMAERESKVKHNEDNIKDEVTKEVEQKTVTNGASNTTDQRTLNVEGKTNELDEPMDVEQENMSDSSKCKDNEDFMCAVLGTSVIQFNENSQLCHKKESGKKLEQKKKCPENKNSEKETDSDQKFDLPEINQSVCDKCKKEFLSIGVLKAHQEECHKDIVPLKNVENLFDDYEQQNATPATFVVIEDAITEASSPSSSRELSACPSLTFVTPSGATPHSLPNSATPSVTSFVSQMPDVASLVTVSHMAAPIQFNQHLMIKGLGMGLPLAKGMNMPFATDMNMHPPLIPLMMPIPREPLMTSTVCRTMIPGATVDPNVFGAQEKPQISPQHKSIKTRINDDQLKKLKAYFDINNSPTEDQILEMSEQSGLPPKVIKHWFCNTLLLRKTLYETQRNKDSPYKFNNPPSTYLNLEENEKTGEIKITSLTTEKVNNQKNSKKQFEEKRESPVIDNENKKYFLEMCVKNIKEAKYSSNECKKSEQPPQNKCPENNTSYNSCMTSSTQQMMAMSEESQSEHPMNKGLSILPGQLDYLYQQYQIESIPSVEDTGEHAD